MAGAHPLKASIINKWTNLPIDFMFNPTEYSLARAVTWKAGSAKGVNLPTQEFEGGKPTALTLKLMFDTTDTGEDVRKYTNPLWKLTMVIDANKNPKTKKGEPPRCEFKWGTVWSFEAVVTNITQNFTMFLDDGTPVRSNVDLALIQIKDSRDFPGTNPTSGGVPGQRTRVVKQGETLDLIAAEEYGDSNHWRFIAEQNHIEHPLRVKPGRVLSLPPLPG